MFNRMGQTYTNGHTEYIVTLAVAITAEEAIKIKLVFQDSFLSQTSN